MAMYFYTLFILKMDRLDHIRLTRLMMHLLQIEYLYQGIRLNLVRQVSQCQLRKQHLQCVLVYQHAQQE